jgi:PEP-CTERM motif-containing protein
MKLRMNSFTRWLGAVAFLTPLLLAAPSVSAYDPGNGIGDGLDTAPGQLKKIPTPEPATLTLLAIGGGAAAVARYRKSRRK